MTSVEILLLDNGSLRPASTLALRTLASRVAILCGRPVHPVSVLHSSKIDPDLLDGQAAETVPQTIKRLLREGKRQFICLPLFFGPSRAITRYLPDKLRPLLSQYPDARLHTAPFLATGDAARDSLLVDILDAHTNALLQDWRHRPIPVVLVDHGTPEPAVNAIRNHLAGCLQQRLAGGAYPVTAASMERREGEAYAFNEPLLEHALHKIGQGPVAVTLLFLHPGRHAGPEGDIAAIIERCRAARPDLEVRTSRLVGEHPLLAELLTQRLREACGPAGEKNSLL